MFAKIFGRCSTILYLKVLRLLEKKPRTDIQDKYGNTALHLACFHGLQNCVLALVRVCGPEVVKLVNQEGKTALHLALEQNFPDIADILTRNGADVTIEYEFYSKRNQRLTEEEINREIEESKSANVFGEKNNLEDRPQNVKQKEIKRSIKYAPMLSKWKKTNQEPGKLKSRLIKGFPNCLRGELWGLLLNIQEISNPKLYNVRRKKKTKLYFSFLMVWKGFIT